MAALQQEGLGQGAAKRPQVPGLIDAGLVPLQSLMHHCWHTVSNSHYTNMQPNAVLTKDIVQLSLVQGYTDGCKLIPVASTAEFDNKWLTVMVPLPPECATLQRPLLPFYQVLDCSLASGFCYEEPCALCITR